jgi:DNA-binding transcriptional regulator YdaS (Cro superfamily)
MTNAEKHGLARAVEILGTQVALASSLGLRQSTIWHWLKAGKPPAEWVLPIERATREAGQEVSRHDLRPDIYPRDEITIPTPVAEQFNPQAAE